MAWLLDTNAWIHYLKNPGSRIRAGLETHVPDEIVVCAGVKAELLHGAQKYGAPERRTAIVQETLAPYRSLPIARCLSTTRRRNIMPASGMNWRNPAGGSGRTIFSSPPSASRTIAFW